MIDLPKRLMQRKIKWLRQLIAEDSKTWNTIKEWEEARIGFLWGRDIEEFEALQGEEEWKGMEETLTKKYAGIENYKLK